MRVHLLEREQWIPGPLSEVFGFFSRAENLERITPPWLRFRIRGPGPVAMRPGTRIDYSIRLAGLPVGWRTRIEVWEPGRRFLDVQERGPYRLWEHEHRFRPLEGGVLMGDRVRYALPLGVLGGVAHALAVRAALAAIFDHRFAAVRSLFPAELAAREAVVRASPADGRPGDGPRVEAPDPAHQPLEDPGAAS